MYILYVFCLYIVFIVKKKPRRLINLSSYSAGLEFFETSAKENINVKAVFERLVDIICDKMSESLDSDPTLVSSQAKGTRLTENTNPQASGCQC